MSGYIITKDSLIMSGTVAELRKFWTSFRYSFGEDTTLKELCERVGR